MDIVCLAFLDVIAQRTNNRTTRPEVRFERERRTVEPMVTETHNNTGRSLHPQMKDADDVRAAACSRSDSG